MKKCQGRGSKTVEVTFEDSCGKVVRYAALEPGEAVQEGQQVQRALQGSWGLFSLCQESLEGMRLYVSPAQCHHLIQICLKGFCCRCCCSTCRQT